MSYQPNRGNNRGNTQKNPNNSNDGQTAAKRRRPNRWSNKSKVNNGVALKRERRSDSESYDIDSPLFKFPFTPQRNRQSYSYDDDRYSYNDQQYPDDRYDNFGSPSYRPLASPGRNMREAQMRKSQHDTRSRHFIEPHHAGPSWHWDKYFNEIHNWQDKHKLFYYKSRCMALEFENQMLFDQVKSLIEENSVFAAERGEMPTMLLPNFPGGLKGFEDENATAEKTTTVDTPKDKDKEQKEKKAEKKKVQSQEKKEQEQKTEGPKVPRGSKRKEELEQLYGENAELIQQLETSIQHDFNRDCDTYNPQMWMDVPLNPEAVA